MTDDEDAFLAAIEAEPTDRVLRGAFADWLDEHGRADTAAAVRATVGKRPRCFEDGEAWGWNSLSREDIDGESNGLSRLDSAVFGKLTGEVPPIEYVAPYWRDYPTFAAALEDLWRAWVEVHCGEGAPCG